MKAELTALWYMIRMLVCEMLLEIILKVVPDEKDGAMLITYIYSYTNQCFAVKEISDFYESTRQP